MLHEKLQRVEARYKEIEGAIARPEILTDQETYQKLLKELSLLKDTVDKFHALKQVEKEKADLQGLLRDNADEEMKGLVEADLAQANEREAALKLELEGLLLPKDPYEDKNIFLEIRAGTGGEEAALFAGDLLRMYLRYAENQGWKAEIAEENSTGLGGYKEVIVEIIGKSVYGKMKYESGTHRVQRVPATEASGRIHTSAVTVAVLPEVEDIDLKIEDKDLRIDVYRSSGPGGQNVNKTSSAVRITHLPTGTVVACQNERSQHQNKFKAMQLLRSRILDEMEKRQKKELADSRKILVGSGDRSEKIRTYNYPQGRVTDHRIGLTIYNLEHILDGNIDEIINALIAADRLAKIAKIK